MAGRKVQGHLPIHLHLQGMTLGISSSCQSQLLHWGNYQDIQSSRPASSPLWEVNISRSVTGTQQQSRSLPARSQSSRLRGREEDVRDGIMTKNPVTIPPTSHLMISKGVSWSQEIWTDIGAIEKRETQPKFLVLVVEIQGRISSIACASSIAIPTKSHTSPCCLQLSCLAVLISCLGSPAQYINVTIVITVYNERQVQQLRMLVFITNSDRCSYSD